MKKGLKMLAVGLIAGIVATSTGATVKAATKNTYSINVYKKYTVLTDEGTLTLPETYHFDDGSDDGYDAKLQSIHNALITFSNNFPDSVKYNQETRQLTAKYFSGYSTHTDEAANTLFTPDGSINDYTSSDIREKLIRIAEIKMIKSMYEREIASLEERIKTSEGKSILQWTTQKENYEAEVERISQLNLEDIPKMSNMYSAISTIVSSCGAKSNFDQDSWAHLGDTVNLSYYYYVILLRDLRLSSLKYSVNGAEAVDVPEFNLDTKTYTVELPKSTPTDATITTSSVSYTKEQDIRFQRDYDSGITIDEANIKLVNGEGTAEVKVKFDASKYDVEGTYEKVYTINFKVSQTDTPDPEPNPDPDPQDPQTYRKGDLDKSGLINSTDSALALDIFKRGNPTDEELKYGDMNGDKIINSSDAGDILDIYASEGGGEE